MAVYTQLGAGDLAALLAHYDVGELVSAKGIAEGVSNSNWLIETTGTGEISSKSGASGNRAQFILTMYERRIDVSQLPYFLGLLDHLAAKGCPVPRTIHDRSGTACRQIDGKWVALIEYLPGISPDMPSPVQARAVGQALAGIHLASQDYTPQRANELRPRDWAAILDAIKPENLAAIDPALPEMIMNTLPKLLDRWPEHLPHGTIHADLFPDNVLMLDDTVCGLIDFYFACHDITAYDLAVTHAAWCFTHDGGEYRENISDALIGGYESRRSLLPEERDALPLLMQGACMRFIATRAADWIDTPADALVRRKDPMDFARRMHFYGTHGPDLFVK